jgi:hypothetical protein
VLRAGGRVLWKTRHGLVDAADVRRQRGSSFRGTEVGGGGDGPVLPVAWTLPSPTQKTVAARVEPGASAREQDRLPPRTLLTVQGFSDDEAFVETSMGWVARRDVRVATVTDPPPEVGPHERWLDIDLDEQVLVAYEGPRPVYATMISSGRYKHRTPTGTYRITRKVAERTMNSMSDSDELYSVDKVPWTAYFAEGYALHAAFWHSGFGRTRSHGCVNLAPGDARHLYAWTAPLVAPGWKEVYGHASQPGSMVRIRDRRHPEPKLRGYARALVPGDDDPNGASASTQGF